MNNNKNEALHTLVEEIRNSECSDFYRVHWNKAGRISHITAKNLVKTPLDKRIYAHVRGITKIVQSPEGPFLMHIGLEDIAADPFGTPCERPMILLSDPHEAVEKSLWFYEHNMLPLIGEINNIAVAAYTAKKYNIDALVTDFAMYAQLLPQLEREYDVTRITEITFIERQCACDQLESAMERFESVRFLLALPETGLIAQACPVALKSNVLRFHANCDVLIEENRGMIVVSKLRMLPTPIIRYRTGIKASIQKEPCTCGLQESIVLHK